MSAEDRAIVKASFAEINLSLEKIERRIGALEGLIFLLWFLTVILRGVGWV